MTRDDFYEALRVELKIWRIGLGAISFASKTDGGAWSVRCDYPDGKRREMEIETATRSPSYSDKELGLLAACAVRIFASLDSSVLRELLEKAAPAPWCWNDDEPGVYCLSGALVATVQEHGNLRTVQRTGERYSHADARLIASAPLLAEEVLKLRAQIEQEKEVLDPVRVLLDVALLDHARLYGDDAVVFRDGEGRPLGLREVQRRLRDPEDSLIGEYVQDVLGAAVRAVGVRARQRTGA